MNNLYLKYFAQIIILLTILSCQNEEKEYQNLISKIEKDNLFEDLKEFNFTQRGEYNWIFYNKSIHFVYHKSNSSNFISSSTANSIFDSISKLYFSEITKPQKIFIYNLNDKYSIQRKYVVNGSMKNDSLFIGENDYFKLIFDKSELFYKLNRDYKLNLFTYNENKNLYKFIIKPEEELIYTTDFNNVKELNLLNSKLKENWYLIQQKNK